MNDGQRERFIALSAYIKNKLKKNLEICHTGNLPSQLKAPRQKELSTPKKRRQQNIIKLKAEINETKIKKTIQRGNETQLVLGKKINKIHKPL